MQWRLYLFIYKLIKSDTMFTESTLMCTPADTNILKAGNAYVRRGIIKPVIFRYLKSFKYYFLYTAVIFKSNK